MIDIIKKNIEELIPEMIKVRHLIHAHPELADEESATANKITQILERFGYHVQTNLAGFGVSTVLDSKKNGKTIAIRVEMDALPIQEETIVPYRSLNHGKMHACGHDGHIAILLVLAGALSKCKELFKGKIKFIFQPAEENLGMGAIKMVEQGILQDPCVDAIFAFHSTHRFKTNMLATRKGCLLSGHDTFEIAMKGRGGYVSSTKKECSPIYAGSILIQKLETLSKSLNLMSGQVIISVTQFHAGDTYNIIPHRASLLGSIRAISQDIHELIRSEIKDIVGDLNNTFDLEMSVEFKDSLRPIINGNKETEIVLKCASQVLSENNIVSTMEPIMAPEGFSYYLENIPGCFFFLGNGQENPIHQSRYNFNDQLIGVAAELLSLIAINYLNSE